MIKPDNNVCQAYHTPFYLKDKLPSNVYYNRHLFFTRENIHFYCLLSEYAILKDTNFSDPAALDHVARNIKNSLSKLDWPKKLTTQFLSTTVSDCLRALDRHYFDKFQKASEQFQAESSHSCCSISIIMHQEDYIWGVQLGMTRVGLTALNPQTGTFECIVPSCEHAYYREFEEKRLNELGLSNFTCMEVFEHEFPSLPTRSIGNYFMKYRYQNSKLGNAVRPPVICTPDIWGPLNIKKDGIKHFFILNNDFFKAIEVFCMRSQEVSALERLSHFIWQDYQNNNNYTDLAIFKDSSRRVIENVLNSLNERLQNFYIENKIVDLALILGTFEVVPMNDRLSTSLEDLKNPSDLLGVSMNSDKFNLAIPSQCKLISNNPTFLTDTSLESFNPIAPRTTNQPPQDDINRIQNTTKLQTPDLIDVNSTDSDSRSSGEYNSLPADFNPIQTAPFTCYLKFPKADKIWTYTSYEQLL